MNIIFDIDDTIYYKNDLPLTKMIYKELIKISKTHDIYLATQRQEYNLKPVLNLINDGIIKDVICGNGAYTLSGIYREGSCINKVFLNKLGNYEYLAISQSGIYQVGSSHWGLATFYEKKFVNEVDELENISSVVVQSKRSDTLEQIITDAGLKFRFNDKYNNYNISEMTCDKLSMINYLSLEEFHGFGNDKYYDAPFIEAAIYGRLIVDSNVISEGECKPRDFLNILSDKL